MKNYMELITTGGTKRAERICLVGVEGIGKTTAGASTENPVFICSEDGLISDELKSIPKYQPETWEDVKGFCESLITEKHNFKSLVIDTVDWIEPKWQKFVCDRDGKKNIDDYGYGKGQVAAAEELRNFLCILERLQKAKNMSILLNVHCQVKLFSNPLGDDYDRFEPAIEKKCAALIKQWCDVVLFARYKDLTYKKSVKGKAKGAAGQIRVVHTIHSFAWDAKNRHGLPEEMPFDMRNIVEAIRKGENQEKIDLLNDINSKVTKLPEATQIKIKSYVKDTMSIIDLKTVLNRINTLIEEQEESNSETQSEAQLQTA